MNVCVELLEAMAVLQLQRNDFHFGAAVHSCELLGAWPEAFALLRHMGSLHASWR